MKTFAVSESLFANAARTPGFLWLVLAGAALLLTLPVTTGFGLGRELLMIREAAFGTLFILPFACSLLACATNSGRTSAGWRASTLAMAGSRFKLTAGFVLHSTLAGVSSLLFLAPFLAASLCFFHGLHALGLLCGAAGAVSVAIAFAFAGRRRFSTLLFLAPALAGTSVAGAILLGLPDGAFLLGLTLFSAAPVALLGSVAGAACAALPGPSGLILAVAFFLAGNLGEALGSTGAAGVVSSFLPDLAALNPSLISSSPVNVPAAGFILASLYSLLLILGTLAAAFGVVSLKEEPA